MKRQNIFYLFTGLILLLATGVFYTKKIFAYDPNLSPPFTQSCIFVSDYPNEARSDGGLQGHEPGNIYTRWIYGDCASSTPCVIAACYLPIIRSFDEEGGVQHNPDPDPTHRVCSTGRPDRDLQYFGVDNSRDPQLPSVQVIGSATNTLPPGPFAGVPTRFSLTGSEGRDYANESMWHYNQFFAMGDGIPLGTGEAEEEEEFFPIEGQAASEQLGQLEFSNPNPTMTALEGQATSCTTIYWDPYGIVFDADSLEPLNKSMAKVTLLDETGKPAASLLNVSNSTIDVLGKYNIYITKDGKYKLDLTSATHDFARVTPNLNYKSLYKNLFMPGDPAFLETLKTPVRVDLAVKSKATPYVRPVTLYSKQQESVHRGGQEFIQITIRVTHPLSLVKVLSNGREIKNGVGSNLFKNITDRDGIWQALIKKELISQYGLSIELRKNPNYYPNKNSANDKPLVVEFEPILGYIKGYAFDDKNQVVVNAVVEVKLKMNNRVFYKTTADEQGYFVILPKNLPPYEYYLQFTNPENNKKISQTTLGFVRNNKDFLDSNNLNLTAKPSGNQEIATASPSIDFSGGNFPQDRNNQNSGNNIVRKSTGPNLMITVIALILLLMTAVSIGIVLFIKKNQQGPIS